MMKSINKILPYVALGLLFSLHSGTASADAFSDLVSASGTVLSQLAALAKLNLSLGIGG